MPLRLNLRQLQAGILARLAHQLLSLSLRQLRQILQLVSLALQILGNIFLFQRILRSFTRALIHILFINLSHTQPAFHHYRYNTILAR